MLKHLIALIILSVLVIFFMPYAQQITHLLLRAHEWISQLLTNVFAGGEPGKLAKDVIALLSIPILISFIPAIFYWIIRRHWFPYFMEVVWIVWLLQAGALTMASSSLLGTQ
jgi:hypothetical protein